ncbi:hypothetical protein [Bradyrhizobium sp. ORS 111]|uniref:hypothetical protein n=1 Tax=Bradyrhizobium sp. ORS 111 TaxID=1685958 RepID=UPI00388D92E2
MSLARSFVQYALGGLYERRKAANPKKKLWVIKKSDLQKVLGTSRIGYAQREELRETAMREGIGMAELPDRFYFFNPDDVEELSFNMTSKEVAELKKWTSDYDRLKKVEADREWEAEFGS